MFGGTSRASGYGVLGFWVFTMAIIAKLEPQVKLHGWAFLAIGAMAREVTCHSLASDIALPASLQFQSSQA